MSPWATFNSFTMPSTPAKTSCRSTGSSVPFDSSVNRAGQNIRISSTTSTAPAMLSVLGSVRACSTQRVLPNARHTGIRNKF